MRIFTLVLESLNKHVGGGNFILERASIDEFYLDITKYCYTKDESNKAFEEKQRPKTVIVGPTNGDNDYLDAKRTAAFERACWVTHWIRTDVWQTIGFTMSAGISTNKTMAKLAASYGKPNGQALLPPQNFPYCLRNIKIQKVRNFGGKLGKQILQKFLSGSDESATMEDLAQIPLPVLQKSLSSDTAQFVYLAARGIDREAVKETTGALVKSITAFKSFTATSDKEEIETWLEVLSSEVISRVQKDTSRNHRYPKSCTLNYTYYTTPSGQRPKDGTHRSQRYTKSLRLEFPNERQANKASNLKKQAMEILLHIIKEQPLRGVGLSANNFESRGGAGGSIDRFFASGPTTSQITNSIPTTAITRVKSKQKPHGVGRYFTTAPSSQNESSSSAAVLNVEKLRSTHNSSSAYQSDITTAAATSHQQVTITIEEDYLTLAQQPTAQQQQLKDVLQPPNSTPTALVDRDMEMAKKLQASFDRENYVLSKAEQKRLPAATNVQRKQKIRKIDSFFGKR
jgi:DNA polymerase eta